MVFPRHCKNKKGLLIFRNNFHGIAVPAPVCDEEVTYG